MKRTRYCIVCLIFVFAVNFCTNVFAANSSFQTEQLLDKEKNDFLSAINITLLNEEPQKDAIDYFDVTEDGLLVVTHSDYDNKKYICVYDKTEFVYGYSLTAYGDVFVECIDENINIHFFRGNYMVSVNQNEVADVALVTETSDNNRKIRSYTNTKEKTVDGKTYIVKNDTGLFKVLSSKYTKVVVEENNKETVIYDVNSKHFQKSIIGYVAGIAVIAVSFIRARKVYLDAQTKPKKTGEG